ncbi:winged helix-turn-helix domain-containing protein [Streptomyces griseorubiginosus]|uniref:winged helix-turn-helix domain-containing protein n=1 Tax=Streptomyces griseorubiginosus TaxID=67304 RepID=UPI0036B33324
MHELSLPEARTIAVSAQGLHLPAPEPDALSTLRALGCIQLDTISVVRRSHELVQLARGVEPSAAARLTGPSGTPVLFEYWAHAASLIPIELWPLFRFRRHGYQTRGWSGPPVDAAACDHVRAVLAERGAVTISDVGGAQGSGWERSSMNKWALEWLLAIGDVACVHRRGWQRVYQLTETVIPQELRDQTLSSAECVRALAAVALRALGVATAGDVADYFRLPVKQVALIMTELDEAERAQVEGWPEPAWVCRPQLHTTAVIKDLTTPLSPFDSLIWHRPRMQRLFGVEYLLEAYKPARTRQCGYFGMPVLAGTEITGRIAVRISKGQAHVEGYQVADGHDPERLQTALQTLCAWGGARDVPVFSPHIQPTGAAS